MPPVGYETTISAGKRPQKYALDRAVTGTVSPGYINPKKIFKKLRSQSLDYTDGLFAPLHRNTAEVSFLVLFTVVDFNVSIPHCMKLSSIFSTSIHIFEECGGLQ
jgi:hypothetical protein